MSNDAEISKRILEAAFGRSPDRDTARRNCSNDEFVVITTFGASGKRALAEFEKDAGPLVGPVAGMSRPCRMESRVGGEFTLFLFSIPKEIVPRARLRVEQRWITEGFGYAIAKVDPREFQWVGEEAEGKISRGVCMDSYPAPQLSAEWTELLICSPGVNPQKALSVVSNLAPAAKPPMRPLEPISTVPNRPRAFSLRAEGSAGKQSLAKLEKRFGKVPAQLKFGGANQQSLVFPVAPESVAVALAGQGEIAPGLFLERETVFVPTAGFARAATVWLNLALAAAKK